MLNKLKKGRKQKVMVFDFKNRTFEIAWAPPIRDGICELGDKVMAVSKHSYLMDGDTGERIAVVDKNTVVPLDARKLPDAHHMPFSRKDLYEMGVILRRRNIDWFLDSIGKRPFNWNTLWTYAPFASGMVALIAVVIYKALLT